MNAKRWNRHALAIAGLCVAVVFFLSFHVVSNFLFRTTQLDLTEGKIYTLSDSTRQILGAVKEPVRLRLFLSGALTRENPGYASYAARVKELLERYVTLAGGNIALEYIDPQPFSPAEDRAVGFGLQAVPLDAAGEVVYFGLVGTNTTDDTDVIPFLALQREKFLEYDLTRMINNLSNPKKRVIGIVTGAYLESDPIKQWKPWRITEMIRQSYETRSVYEVKQLTDEIDVLMIVHPAGLDDKMLYAIDQFILKGGKAMVFVDPFSEEVTRANQTQRMPPDFGSDFEKLFKAWGIAYDRKKFVGDRQAAQRVAAGEDARGRPIITDYLAWLTFKGDALRRGDPITDELQVINVATAGAIAKADGATIELEPLVATSKDSMLIDVDKVRLEPKPAELMRDFKSDDKSYIIAARLTGVLKTAFPDGPPKDEKAAEKKDETAAPDGEKKEEAKPELPADHLAQSKGPVNLIVAADVDILADRFWTRIQDFFGQQLEVPIANNADFTLNALDNVAGGTALASLRSRSLTSRPFELVADIQKNAEARFRAKEQQLVQKLEDVEKKLKELQSKQPGQGEGQAQAPTPAQAAAKTILTEQQAKEIDDFRREMVTTRSELREVQRALREDIDKLDARLKVVNIGLMPALVLLVAILLALARRAKARRRHHLPAG
ncbi:MAG TPA: Gldg family protein [Alphaproteobacteria bacterium]